MNEQLNKICKIWFNLETHYKTIGAGLSKTAYLKKLMSFDKIASPAANLKGMAKQNISEDEQSIKSYETLSLILDNAEELLKQDVEIDDNINLDRLLRGEIESTQISLDEYNVAYNKRSSLKEAFAAGEFGAFISEDNPAMLINCVSDTFLYLKNVNDFIETFKFLITKVQEKRNSEFDKKALAIIKELVATEKMKSGSFVICKNDSLIKDKKVTVGGQDLSLEKVFMKNTKVVPNGNLLVDVLYYRGEFEKNGETINLYIVEE